MPREPPRLQRLDVTYSIHPGRGNQSQDTRALRRMRNAGKEPRQRKYPAGPQQFVIGMKRGAANQSL
jgi:hypothetical protein